MRGTSCRDFAGVVPATRGAYCRPLDPRLAPSRFVRKKPKS